MLRRVQQETIHITLKFPSFNLSMFTEEDGTSINNEVRKEF